MPLIYLHHQPFCSCFSWAEACQFALLLEQLHGPAQVHVLR